jgi:DNA-binding FadR family transcriptional regulator
MSIAAGEFAAGEQISPETLAETFAVSRSVVREVLKVLEAKGMIGARPRTGTRVRPQTWWNLLDPDVIRWRSTGPDSARQLEELLGIRGAIEPLAARNATSAATPSDIQTLTESLDAMSDAVASQNWLAFTEADVAFHRALLRASGSLVVDQLADPIEAALRVRHKLRLVPTVLSPQVISSHGAILDAIHRHDGAQAELASRQIVDVAGAEVMASLIGGAGGHQVESRGAR